MFPAVFDLTALDGINGFSISGIDPAGLLGWSVSDSGDINGDGISDLIVGVRNAAGGHGASYVLFGNTTLGRSGVFNLSTLNGQNGFSIPGIATYLGNFGSSISSSGDINGDGFSDLIVGASFFGNSVQGAAYVLFGNQTLSNGGTFNLANLKPQNGFNISGIWGSGQFGSAINSAGDVNGDGISDLIIGAPQVGGYRGEAYVLFGNRTLGTRGTFNLTTLNGQNGFRIPGLAATTGELGYSVSAAGDLNGDGISDLALASPGTAGLPGTVYVIYGNGTLGADGIFNLTALDGQNGFSIPGSPGNNLGSSVAAAGDINDDGFADLILGASAYSQGITSRGISYVLFGNRSLGIDGAFNLSLLNGHNGFSIPGIAAFGQLGYSVALAGDLNGDWIADLIIGARGILNNQGASYVLFGNQTIGVGGIFNLSLLNGQNGFSIPGIAANGLLGWSVSGAGDLNADGFSDLIVGAKGAGGNNEGAAYVIFGKNVSASTRLPTLMPTSNPTFSPTPSPSLIPSFKPSQFPTLSPTNFPTSGQTSSPISSPTDSPSAFPSITPTVVPTFLPTTSPSLAPTSQPMLSSTPIPIGPVLTQNHFTFTNTQPLTLSSSNLQATDAGFNLNNLVFIASNVQNGYFTLSPSNTLTTVFTQAQINAGVIQLIPLGNSAPSFSVIVSDGIYTTLPTPVNVNFLNAPVIQQNALNITQGGTITLTPSSLNVTVNDGSPPSQVFLQVTDIENAVVTNTQTGMPVTNFTLAQLQQGDIQITQDGSQVAPTLTFSATTQNGITSSSSTTTTQFTNNQGTLAPRILRNYLNVVEGQSTLLTPQNINSLQGNGQDLPSDALFYISAITHGQFTFTSDLTNQIPLFTQAQLQNQTVQFTQDNSKSVPTYRIAVSVNGLQCAPMPASIFFRTVNLPPQVLNPIPDQSATVGSAFSFAIPPNTFQDPNNEPLFLSASLFNSSASLPLTFETLNNRLTGIFPHAGVYDIDIQARDTSGLSTHTDFIVNVQNPPPSKTSLQTTIISATVSGFVGLGFFGIKLGLQYLADKKLKGGKDEYDQKVVSPIAQAIAKRVKITGFMDILSTTTAEDFKGAVRTLLTEIDLQGINIRIDQMDVIHRDALVNEVATQTKLHLVGKDKCCRTLVGFFKAEASADDLRHKAKLIAVNVAAVHGARYGKSQVEMPDIKQRPLLQPQDSMEQIFPTDALPLATLVAEPQPKRGFLGESQLLDVHDLDDRDESTRNLNFG